MEETPNLIVSKELKVFPFDSEWDQTLSGGEDADFLAGAEGTDAFDFNFKNTSDFFFFYSSGQPTPESGIDRVEDYNSARLRSTDYWGSPNPDRGWIGV